MAPCSSDRHTHYTFEYFTRRSMCGRGSSKPRSSPRRRSSCRPARRTSSRSGPSYGGVWTRGWLIWRNSVRLDITVGPRSTDGRPADAEVASNKSSFKMKFNGLIWSLTTGLQFIVGWWYRKSAVFYLPAGWFGPLEWCLSFPFAPAGESRHWFSFMSLIKEL